MAEETKLAYDKWLELIEKILEVYITQRKLGIRNKIITIIDV